MHSSDLCKASQPPDCCVAGYDILPAEVCQHGQAVVGAERESNSRPALPSLQSHHPLLQQQLHDLHQWGRAAQMSCREHAGHAFHTKQCSTALDQAAVLQQLDVAEMDKMDSMLEAGQQGEQVTVGPAGQAPHTERHPVGGVGKQGEQALVIIAYQHIQYDSEVSIHFLTGKQASTGPYRSWAALLDISKPLR